MHSRTMSDQVTAGVIGTLTYGTCTLFHVARPASIVVAVCLYAVLVGAFALYRRQLRTLQPGQTHMASEANVAVLTAIDAAKGERPTPRRRRLHAA